jgi:N-acetylmuramoyl-L-alanine amidase
MASSAPEAVRRAPLRRFAQGLSSPYFRVAFLLVLTCFVTLGTSLASVPSKKHEALLLFNKAEKMREALNGRPEAKRTRRDYQHVMDAYRSVYYTSPVSSKADDSVMAVAELLAAMGRQFPPGDKDLHSAIGQYLFLRREYPGSRYRMEALFAIGQIYEDDLDDPKNARATFEEFLRRYPHDERAPKASQAIAEIDHPRKKEAMEEAHASKPAGPSSTSQLTLTEISASATDNKKGLELVTGIRHWSSPDSIRVAIDVDGPVEYQAGRVSNPDRIFFDLSNTKLASTLVGKSFDVEDGFLKRIRVGQYQPDSTRVVLDVDSLSEYSAFVLPNPYRLIIDVHGRQGLTAEQAARESGANSKDAGSASISRSIISGNVTPGAEVHSLSGRPTMVNPPGRAAESVSPGAQTARSERPPSQVNSAVRAEADNRSGKSGSSLTSSASHPSLESDDDDELLTSPGTSEGAGIKATSRPTSAPTAVAVAPRGHSGAKTNKAAVSRSAAREASPTSDGDRSLIRALGLKIGRIVIDAGHGGHDTGTIGPTGFMEKDLVLDVSLRLGRLLQARLGADVIYTRDDDTFVPLETRTAIANEKQADLFISIHANSSPDPAARGVETYYLNFTSDPDALEVAARENAVSQKSIHQLQDLVKKIALKEKIEESRELASDVQESLYSGLSPRNPGLHNRGVKKAPFVVLIGANMPSILAEISFVSNPTDERRLESEAYRQKIAEALYRGIAKYVGGLSGVKVASKISKEGDE